MNYKKFILSNPLKFKNKGKSTQMAIKIFPQMAIK